MIQVLALLVLLVGWDGSAWEDAAVSPPADERGEVTAMDGGSTIPPPPPPTP